MRNIDQVLLEALDPLLPGCAAPVAYTGESLEYIVWNYDQLGAVFADGRPDAARYLVQVHYFLPAGQNPNGMKVRIAQALAAAGCTWPDVTDASDKEGQHYVLECEYADGGLAHGYA